MSTEAGVATLKAAVEDVRRPRTDPEAIEFMLRAISDGWITQIEVDEIVAKHDIGYPGFQDSGEKIWQLACKRILTPRKFYVQRGGP